MEINLILQYNWDILKSLFFWLKSYPIELCIFSILSKINPDLLADQVQGHLTLPILLHREVAVEVGLALRHIEKVCIPAAEHVATAVVHLTVVPEATVEVLEMITTNAESPVPEIQDHLLYGAEQVHPAI